MIVSPPPTFRPIDDIDAMDLSRHALVEASAGTGKTYTIENLVLRLLMEEPDLNLENILLVTFTEKATSELRLRIRQKIEKILDGDRPLNDDIRKKLMRTLDDFDNAAIYTIHGFCHTLLKEFPFETGNLFHQEVIDDGPLLERLLRVQMRVDWPRRYKGRLDVLLDLSNFSANPEGFIQTAVILAHRLSDDPTREIIIPDPERLDVDDLWQSAQKAVLAIKSMVGPSPQFSDGYRRLNINARTKAAVIRDVVEPIERALEGVGGDACPVAAMITAVTTLGARHSSGERNIDRLVPRKWLKAGENLAECPGLVAVANQLEELLSVITRLSHVLMLTAVCQLRKDARAMKLRNGWLSYSDMLARVADFLAGEGADEGIRKIRDRYRLAFVDEFQDTDDLQWLIFSTLFLQGHVDPPINRLFLIGDPKQAIYAFRGADVYTYLDARQQMIALAGLGQANLYDLTVNWRSSPQLTAGFNRIFSQNAWFGKQGEKPSYEIGYLPSRSPDANHLSAMISDDRSKRPPLNVMDLTAATSHAAAKAMLARFICREIHHLTGQGRIRLTHRDGSERALHFGDIAILVRSQSEFALIEPRLKEAAIPFAYYRKPGLFQCREAHWLSMMLRAVSNPQRAPSARLALLTPFFDISPTVLELWQELPANHTSQQLLARWHALALRRQWGPLFQSLVEDSGLNLRHCDDPGWDRSETNFQQLFDYLEVSAYTRNLDIGGMAALLDGLRIADMAAGSDDDIHQIEDEADKVQILTMHVSKGLEFPVVFVAGGLTVRKDGGIQVYHTADPVHPGYNRRKVIDLTASTGNELAEKEIEEENKRLYYVAFTRARLKLYIPYYPDERNYSWLGPICRFVSHSIGQVFLHPEDATLPGGGWHDASITAAVTSDPKATRYEEKQEPLSPLTGNLLPDQTDYRHRRIFLESFSSIGRRLVRPRDSIGRPGAFQLSDVGRREEDERAAINPLEALEPQRTEELPGGTRMGSMFHHVFEHIDFQMIMEGPADILTDDAARLVIESSLAHYRIAPRWTATVARLVAATLRTPIHVGDPPLVLGQLGVDQRRHEVEFYFPLVAKSPLTIKVPGCNQDSDSFGKTVIRGFVDLLFLWQGRYYIADWKSNRLEAGYDQSAMAREMALAGYMLQYQLYTIATLRWLKHQLGDHFNPLRHFGGAFYLFIRGMGVGGEGIFHVPPEQLLPLNALEHRIQERIAGLKW